MIAYNYRCENCKHEFEYHVPMSHRDLPTTKPCPKCNHFDVIRPPQSGGFSVPEGGVGNAANNYSSYHGDSELAKAKGTPRYKQLRKDYGLDES